MNPVSLDCVRHLNQILVNHRNKCGVVPSRQLAKHGFKGLNVVRPVVGRKRDTGEQNLHMRILKAGQDGIEIAPRLVERNAPESVVAPKFDDRHFGMKLKDGVQAGHGILAGGAAGALVIHCVGVTVTVKFPL